MTPTTEIPRLTRAQVSHYKRMQELAEEKSRLNARIAEIDKARKEEEAVLLETFGDAEMLRVNARLVLEKNTITVAPAVIQRPGYTYYRWKEIAG